MTFLDTQCPPHFGPGPQAIQTIPVPPPSPPNFEIIHGHEISPQTGAHGQSRPRLTLENHFGNCVTTAVLRTTEEALALLTPGLLLMNIFPSFRKSERALGGAPIAIPRADVNKGTILVEKGGNSVSPIHCEGPSKLPKPLPGARLAAHSGRISTFCPQPPPETDAFVELVLHQVNI